MATTDNDRQEKMRDLLHRAGVCPDTISHCDEDELIFALDIVRDLFDERRAPDKHWLRDMYLLTGDHMVLTDEGWMPADQNTRDVTGEDPLEILEEVNAPAKEISP